MATFYVSETGAGAKDGTTVATAWDVAGILWSGAAGVEINAGDTLYVLGVITSRISVGVAGTSGSPVTIRGDYEGQAGDIDMGGANECILLSSKNYVTVKNIALTDGGDDNGALINITSANFIGDNITITNPSRRGISFTGAGDYTGGIVRNCTINTTANDGVGIRISAATTGSVLVHDNTITSTSASPVAADHKGIDINAGSDTTKVYNNNISGCSEGIAVDDSDSVLVYNNTISSFTSGVVSRCIVIDGTSGNCETYANNCTGGSICILDDSEALAPGPNKYYGNLVKGYYTNGIDYRSDDTGYAYICNNTIIHTAGDTAGHGLVIQLQVAATANAYIYNNVIECVSTGTNLNGIMIDSAKCNDVTVGYNVYYQNGGQVFGFDGSDLIPDNVPAWSTQLLIDGATTYAGGDEIVTTDPLDSSYNLVAGASAVGTGTKWWTGANPIGTNGEPFSDWDTDSGANQSTLSQFHPMNL